MPKRSLVFLVAAAAAFVPRVAATQTPQDIARWEQRASRVTITRDDWGIAHVRGHTDADAVFGALYAQAEDDFNRIEANYINSLGRLAEAEGASQIWRDLRTKLFIHPDTLAKLYTGSPDWLKQLMDAFADGLNFYLYKHPEVKPRVITHFEPWMVLSLGAGQGAWGNVNLDELAAFYGRVPMPARRDGMGEDDGQASEPLGSNSIAIAPKNTLNGHALLWLNPHTSFFFRSELQMTSDEGLNAYGAVTWGHIFVHQGFNPTAGWQHTTSGVDNVDEFLETVTQRGDGYVYKHGAREIPMTTARVTVPYRTAAGMADTTFTVYYTGHGPIVRSVGDRWVSISQRNSPVDNLIHSYTTTKAKNYADMRQIMEVYPSGGNTMVADAEGNIAYFPANYIPRRDTSFDWTKPVDGSDPATDYQGRLALDETPVLVNPATGWLYNANNWPWSAAGESSLKRSDYPVYVDRGTEESPRGYHALRVLPGHTDFTMTSLTAAAFDSYLPAFATMLPSLIKAYDALPATDSLKTALAKQMTVLGAWDYRWGINSVATSLAVFWGTEVFRRVGSEARAAGMSSVTYVAQRASHADLLQSLAAASDKLAADFGNWQTPWGDINRFQRLNNDIEPRFDDAKPSIAVPFTSARWGSLASFGAQAYPNTKKWYGTSGNSFVAVVEFGDSVRARAVTAGGESGDVNSPHFNDQAERYATGNLRTVYFYPSQLTGHTERVYHPGS